MNKIELVSAWKIKEKKQNKTKQKHNETNSNWRKEKENWKCMHWVKTGNLLIRVKLIHFFQSCSPPILLLDRPLFLISLFIENQGDGVRIR